MSEEIRLKKAEVDEALKTFELRLFGRSNEGNPQLNPPIRMAVAFAEAYHTNTFPPESVILRQSYALLKEKGYYYNITEQEIK